MDFNVSKYLDYREIIRRASKRQRISFKSLSNSCRIHSSYFSRVMTGKAEFSPEQLYLIAVDLGFNDWEMEYFLLLGEHQGTGNNQHRTFLRTKIEKIREHRRKVISQLEDVEDLTRDQIWEYYQEVTTSMVHMYLTIDKYMKRPQLICGKLQIDDHKLKLEMEKLQRLGIISIEDPVRILKYSVHHDESEQIAPNVHTNWRLDAIAYINKRNKKPSDIHISAQFSTDEESKLQIKELFSKFVAEAQKITSQKKQNEEVYRIAFDLY